MIDCLKQIFLILDFLSFMSGSFIVIMYVTQKKLRCFALLIMVQIAICDILKAIANFLVIDENILKNSYVCYLQSFMINYFHIGAIGWTNMLILTLYLCVIKYKDNIVHKIRHMFILIQFLSFIIVYIQIQSKNQEIQENFICDFTYDVYGKLSIFIDIFTLLPQLFTVIFSSFAYYSISKVLQCQKNDNINYFIKSLSLFPFLVTFRLTAGIINMIDDYGFKGEFQTNQLCLIIDASQGLLNSAFISYQNKKIRNFIKQCFCFTHNVKIKNESKKQIIESNNSSFDEQIQRISFMSVYE